MQGCRGEHVVDDRVWMVHSHYPMKPYSESLNFTSNKIVSIVRNPLDVFPSLMQYYGTMSNSGQLHEEFDKHVPGETNYWDVNIR